uniref:Uncharacterized protein n=1 Tax=Sphaerodactylus townsendi TaxID=933632 RepID=A0ACB8FGX8_9SAUR
MAVSARVGLQGRVIDYLRHPEAAAGLVHPLSAVARAAGLSGPISILPSASRWLRSRMLSPQLAITPKLPKPVFARPSSSIFLHLKCNLWYLGAQGKKTLEINFSQD